LLLLGVAACAEAAPASRAAPTTATAPSSTAVASPAEPPGGDGSTGAAPIDPSEGGEVATEAGQVVDLRVVGFGAAAVAVPVGGAAPHAVAITAHGNYDRPEWECDYWKRLFPETFLLCPRGVPRSDPPAPDDPRFTYEDDRALEEEVEAGLAALRERYGERVDTEARLWIGLSRGAYLGARIAVRQPQRYSRLLLVEGGHDPFTFAAAKRFAEGGGARVELLCGQRSCTQAARRVAQRLAYYGVEARVDEVGGMGHGLSYDADRFVVAAKPWLLAGPTEPPEAAD
jgi:predicted esterase